MTRIKGLSRGITALTDKIRKDLLSPQVIDQLAKQMAGEAATMIKRRTRRGLGVRTEGGSESPLKPLSPDYVDARRRMRLSAFTSPGKSNLTRTSELLESMGVKKSKAGQWTIVFQGQHESGISNSKLAFYVSRERPFLYLSKKELDQLGKSFTKSFDTLVKRKLK